MKNLTDMMKQARELQSKLAETQAELENAEVEGASGAGLVRVTLSGKGTMKRLHVDPSLMKPDEAEILEDLIVAAFNDGKAKAEALVAERMKELTGGLPLPPGMNFGL
ncbi:MAG: YbaB/EbfC family nucleoid-associated protein [Parvibaculaceae bacterium]|nr:YbaB/EbfC family nucleoid-associated protein [Parvibaculaceae bacterium]HBM87882.1 nucleoid-associated protein, YbaB/EbfC family [Rhodobiaceae bacterium]